MFTRKFSGDSDTKREEYQEDTLSKNLQKSLGTAIKFSQNEDRDHQRMLRNQKLLQQYNSMRNNN
jgi:peptide subunit release factor 1 (eRF1)